jgi:tetratricopeptide (TPR) repeat protein
MPELSRKEKKAARQNKMLGVDKNKSAEGELLGKVVRNLLLIIAVVVAFVALAAVKQGTLLPTVFPASGRRMAADGGSGGSGGAGGAGGADGAPAKPTKPKRKFDFRTKKQIAADKAAEEKAAERAEMMKQPFYVAMSALMEAREDKEARAAALAMLKDVVETEPENHMAKQQYGTAIAEDDADEGLAHLDAALALEEKLGAEGAVYIADTQFARGSTLASLDRTEEAVEALKSVVVFPLPSAAQESAQQVERLTNRKVEALLKLNGALIKLGKREEALEYLEKAIEILPQETSLQDLKKQQTEASMEDLVNDQGGKPDAPAVSGRVEAEKEDDADEDDE